MNRIIVELPTEYDWRYGLLVRLDLKTGRAVPDGVGFNGDPYRQKDYIPRGWGGIIGLALEHADTRRMTIRVFMQGAFPSKDEWKGI